MQSKNKVDTYGEPVFVPDYSATVLAAKMFPNSLEHSMHIIFLWFEASLHCHRAENREKPIDSQ